MRENDRRAIRIILSNLREEFQGSGLLCQLMRLAWERLC